MIVTFGVGFYFGGEFNPATLGLNTLFQLAYDREAQKQFETDLGILDSELAQQEFDLKKTEEENESLKETVSSLGSTYTARETDFESQVASHEDTIREKSFDLESAIAGNLRAQEAFQGILTEYYAEIATYRNRLSEANEYIDSLVKLTTGLTNENRLLRDVNGTLKMQNDLMRDRINYLSRPRPRHGPGGAAGLNPMDEWGFAVVVGWTLSWS